MLNFSNSISCPEPTFGAPRGGPAIISISMGLTPGMRRVSYTRRLGSVSPVCRMDSSLLLPHETIVLLGRCMRLEETVAEMRRKKCVYGTVIVRDCCVCVGDAGMSRLRWSLMFRLGWVAILRFTMSASETPITIQQDSVVLL